MYCQQFFKQGFKKQLFEVMREEVVEEREIELDMWAKIQKITAERLEHIEKKAKEYLQVSFQGHCVERWLDCLPNDYNIESGC